MTVSLPNLYTRWTQQSERRVRADVLLPQVDIQYDVGAGEVVARVGGGEPLVMDPDTARMIGVRMIEAATRAEGERRTRS